MDSNKCLNCGNLFDKYSGKGKGFKRYSLRAKLSKNLDKTVADALKLTTTVPDGNGFVCPTCFKKAGQLYKSINTLIDQNIITTPPTTKRKSWSAFSSPRTPTTCKRPHLSPAFSPGAAVTCGRGQTPRTPRTRIISHIVKKRLKQRKQPINKKIALSSPFPQPSFDHYKDGNIQFGKPVRKDHFYIEEECVFLNHGAFGAVLKEALSVAQQWQVYAERQPLRFIDRELLPRIINVTKQMAEFVGADPQDIILVQNVTTGLNSVLKSLHFQPDDFIYTLSIAYGATKKILKDVCSKTGAKCIEVPVTFPIKDRSQIIDLVKETLTGDVKLAVFDHVPSNTPFILPIEELITICHDRGVRVLIDGAHALGSLPLNLVDLAPDFYIANCHKWFCAPKGVGFMYVSREMHNLIHPVVTSHGHGAGLHSEFSWQGLRDYSGWLALSVVIDFWNTVGAENIRHYIHTLACDAGELLVNAWDTELLAPSDMFGSMVLAKLPAALWADCSQVTYDRAEVIQNTLYHQYNIEVPIKAVDGELYVRISAHIYNTIDDYQKLADAILQMAVKNQNGK